MRRPSTSRRWSLSCASEYCASVTSVLRPRMRRLTSATSSSAREISACSRDRRLSASSSQVLSEPSSRSTSSRRCSATAASVCAWATWASTQRTKAMPPNRAARNRPVKRVADPDRSRTVAVRSFRAVAAGPSVPAMSGRRRTTCHRCRAGAPGDPGRATAPAPTYVRCAPGLPLACARHCRDRK